MKIKMPHYEHGGEHGGKKDNNEELDKKNQEVDIDKEDERISELLKETVSFAKNEFQIEDLTTGEILDLRRIAISVIEGNDQYIKAVEEGSASGEHKFPGLYGEVISRWMSELGIDIRFKSGYEFYVTGHLRALHIEDKTTGKDYKELDIKSKLTELTENEIITMLHQNGNLIKRPFALSNNWGDVGFKEESWSSLTRS